MTPQDIEFAAQKAAQLIQNATFPVVLTGAGISTPSGIPDFRSAKSGLWSKNNPMEVASYTAFRYYPEKFFNWLRPLAKEIWNASPNPAHKALSALEARGIIKAIITQNIDGLHQRAGSKNVIEVHGSMESLSCQGCRRKYPSNDFYAPLIEQNQFPYCPSCNRILKPDIILFEEQLPTNAWIDAQNYCESADLILVVGSSLEVTPAASLPLYGLDHGAKIIINTFSETYLDQRAALLLPYDVAEILPRIEKLIQ